jgi:hypothetical protein
MKGCALHRETPGGIARQMRCTEGRDGRPLWPHDGGSWRVLDTPEAWVSDACSTANDTIGSYGKVPALYPV